MAAGNPSNAEIAMREACTTLEALRPAHDATIGGVDTADDPIRDAWKIARQRLRNACAAYIAGAKAL